VASAIFQGRSLGFLDCFFRVHLIHEGAFALFPSSQLLVQFLSPSSFACSTFASHRASSSASAFWVSGSGPVTSNTHAKVL
jgi:hypothetical protein